MRKTTNTYGLPETTVFEMLRARFGANVDALYYGEHVLVSKFFDDPDDFHYRGALYVKSYGKIKLLSVSEEKFDDNGFAIEWALNKAKRGYKR